MLSDDEKRLDLSERIRAAQAKPEVTTPPDTQRNVGYDFVGAVIGSMILGWLIDRAFGTSPWGLVGAVIMGFAVGLMNVWRSIEGSQAPKNKE